MIASFPEVAAYSPRCESCGRERDGEEKAEEREAEAATGRTGRGKYKAMKKLTRLCQDSAGKVPITKARRESHAWHAWHAEHLPKASSRPGTPKRHY